MKTINVVAALIIDKGRVFATQRGYGEFKDGWEFPGGKVEAGETPEQALKREIEEEAKTEIIVGDYFRTIEFDYPNFHLSMRCYFCTVKDGNIAYLVDETCKVHHKDTEFFEHEAAKFVGKDEIDSVKWLPADLTIIDDLKNSLFLR
jgi:8-oxo-dGTP diphosphatase